MGEVMGIYIKAGAMVLLTALVLLGLLILSPALFNDGWAGFFGVPIAIFVVGALLVLAWHRFLKRLNKLGEKNEKDV